MQQTILDNKSLESINLNDYLTKNINTLNISSGTILNAQYASDIFGYNPSYGTYIGGNFNGTGYYLYSGNKSKPTPSISINGSKYDILHSGNFNSWAQPLLTACNFTTRQSLDGGGDLNDCTDYTVVYNWSYGVKPAHFANAVGSAGGYTMFNLRLGWGPIQIAMPVVIGGGGQAGYIWVRTNFVSNWTSWFKIQMQVDG